MNRTPQAVVAALHAQQAAMLGAEEGQAGQGGTQSRNARRNALTKCRKERLERRKNALCWAVEVRLIAMGAGVVSAAKAARALVEKALKLAQSLVADVYDYMGMAFRGM